jgi:hypothetical protein
VALCAYVDAVPESLEFICGRAQVPTSNAAEPIEVYEETFCTKA